MAKNDKIGLIFRWNSTQLKIFVDQKKKIPVSLYQKTPKKHLGQDWIPFLLFSTLPNGQRTSLRNLEIYRVWVEKGQLVYMSIFSSGRVMVKNGARDAIPSKKKTEVLWMMAGYYPVVNVRMMNRWWRASRKLTRTLSFLPQISHILCHGWGYLIIILMNHHPWGGMRW